MRDRVALAITEYRSLLEAFVTGAIDGSTFEAQYTPIYLANKLFYGPEVFSIVDSFFADVDAFVDDPRLFEPENGDLDEADLRARARQLLEAAGG